MLLLKLRALDMSSPVEGLPGSPGITYPALCAPV